jgi:hypothetical protein
MTVGSEWAALRAWALASTLMERRYNPGIGMGSRSAKALSRRSMTVGSKWAVLRAWALASTLIERRYNLRIGMGSRSAKAL